MRGVLWLSRDRFRHGDAVTHHRAWLMMDSLLEVKMSTERPQPASPACLAHEADDAYMGYATKDELAAFLNELLEAERAGTGVALKSGKAAAGTSFAELLRD